MNVESLHLNLENLLATVSGEPPDELARDHLESCPRCRSEARRWEVVAEGVRHLFAATSVSVRPPDATGGLAAWPPNRRAPAWPNPRLRRLVAAAAACALAAGGTAYGMTAAGGSAGHVVSTAAGVAAVSGCSDLHATMGALEHVAGTGLVVRSQFNGQLVTVTASGSTRIRQAVAGSLNDITDGAHVLVSGTSAGRGIAAQRVSVGDSTDQAVPPPKPPPGSPATGTVRIPLTSGTVADAHAGAFTVVTANGSSIPVTTSAATSVFIVAKVGVSQLRAGDLTVAIGTAGPDGTLAATVVEQGVAPALGSAGKLQFPVNRRNSISGPRLGCSAPAIASAALLAAG